MSSLWVFTGECQTGFTIYVVLMALTWWRFTRPRPCWRAWSSSFALSAGEVLFFSPWPWMLPDQQQHANQRMWGLWPLIFQGSRRIYSIKPAPINFLFLYCRYRISSSLRPSLDFTLLRTSELWIKHKKNKTFGPSFWPRSRQSDQLASSNTAWQNFSALTFTVKLRVQVRFKRWCVWFWFYDGSRIRRSTEAVTRIKLMGKTRISFIPSESLYEFRINSKNSFQ